MRLLVACASLLAFSACNATYSNPPPANRFYFPSGVAHVDVAGSENGALFVSGSNWDLRYTSGLFSAVNLDSVALPAFGAAFDGTPAAVVDLGTVATAEISSFAGELGVLDRGAGKLRFFIPSRSEGKHLQAVDAVVGGDVALSCFPAAPADAPSDCFTNAPSLSPAAFEKTVEGVPRASGPYGVSVRVRACATGDDCGGGRTCASSGVCLTSDGEPMADLYVTHIDEVDSPLASSKDPRGYLVHLESDTLTVDTSSFINMGWGGSTSAVTGGRWTYVSGRFPTMTTTAGYGNLLRLVDRAGTVLTTNLQWTHGVRDSRGVALNSDESVLYLAGRNPDVLLVLRIVSPLSDAPSLAVVRSVDLPVAPQQVVVISRPGQGDLVAVACSGNASGQLDGTLVLYDDDVGDLVAQVGGVGLQPYGVAVDRRGAGARLFLSNFGDGRVAVVDVPDLARAQEARLVAHLGDSQLCLTQRASTPGCAETP